MANSSYKLDIAINQNLKQVIFNALNNSMPTVYTID